MSPFTQDPVLFEQLYDRYRPLVYGAALRVLGNPIEAEDVVQSTFLKIWANPHAFRGGNFESWLTSLSKNCAIDVFRRRRREAGSPMIDRAHEADGCDVADEALSQIERRWVARAVRELRGDRRYLLIEAFWNGESHRSIAAAVRLPLGTVKTRIRSGLAELRLKAATAP